MAADPDAYDGRADPRGMRTHCSKEGAEPRRLKTPKRDDLKWWARSSARLERPADNREVGGSNPPGPTNQLFSESSYG